MYSVSPWMIFKASQITEINAYMGSTYLCNSMMVNFEHTFEETVTKREFHATL